MYNKLAFHAQSMEGMMFNKIDRHYDVISCFSHYLTVPLHLMLLSHYDFLALALGGLVLAIYSVATFQHARAEKVRR